MDEITHTTLKVVEEDASMRTVRDLSDPEVFISQVFERQCRYVGIYQPGDFHRPEYRLVLPCYDTPRPGRGYRGAREEVFYATSDRKNVDRVISSLLELAGDGPLVAARHIVNPSNKDEGLRLIWASIQEDASVKEEMNDWPRRDAMIRQGKTVQPVQGSEWDMDNAGLENLNIPGSRMESGSHVGASTAKRSSSMEIDE
ncbi:hypothetical protein BCR39DRAFT_588937 [Naematelia encephala]|uniref:Uncharacterized protein n=1 Tax=Naematelia encephala TaxID=71784 RepID=A0A1Y2AZP5_9TREE|nr:hypothetical protein BCR39DRAFT_588937 [Naematelia encephala]